MEQLAQRKKKIVIGVSGTPGTIYAIDLVKKLKEYPMVETHGTISPRAKQNLEPESDLSLGEFESLFDYYYSNRDLKVAVASGSSSTNGMITVPASMKTTASISVGLGDNLIARATDVAVKKQRELVIVLRETPLNAIHLENLTKLARPGVQIIPPIPAFYNQPQAIQDLVDYCTMKLLDQSKIVNEHSKRWQGD